MILGFQGLYDWWADVFNKYLNDISLKFVAYKTLLYTTITVTLPAVIKNFLAWLFILLTSQVDSMDLSGLSPAVIELSGLASWFAIHLRFMDCMAVLLTAMVIRLILNFIPLVG